MNPLKRKKVVRLQQLNKEVEVPEPVKAKAPAVAPVKVEPVVVQAPAVAPEPVVAQPAVEEVKAVEQPVEVTEEKAETEDPKKNLANRFKKSKKDIENVE